MAARPRRRAAEQIDRRTGERLVGGRDPERAEPHHPAPGDRAGASWTSSSTRGLGGRGHHVGHDAVEVVDVDAVHDQPVAPAVERPLQRPLERVARGDHDLELRRGRRAAGPAGSVMPRALTQVDVGTVARRGSAARSSCRSPGGPTRLIQRSESRAAGRTDSTSSRPITRLSTQAILPRARLDARAGPGSDTRAGSGVRSQLRRTTDAAGGHRRALLSCCQADRSGDGPDRHSPPRGRRITGSPPRRAVAADARRHAGDGSGHFGGVRWVCAVLTRVERRRNTTEGGWSA